MLAIETHRGGQLSPLAAALASALSRGRATVDQGLQVESGDGVEGSKLPHSARPEALVCASEPHVLGLRACLDVSQMVNAVAVPKIDSGGLLSGTRELLKAVSMGLLDTACILGWEPEETVLEGEAVLFSQHCRLYSARGSKWRQVAEGCVQLRKNEFTRKVRLELRSESGFAYFAHFYALCAPPFGVLVPLRVAGWKFYVIDCSLEDPTVQHVALVFASTELAGEFKVAFEEADRVNKMILEAG